MKASLKTQLEKEKSRFATASAAEKPKFKATVDDLTKKIADLETSVAKADQEIDQGIWRIQ